MNQTHETNPNNHLRKMPASPNKFEARDILRKAGYSFRKAKELTDTYMKELLNVQDEKEVKAIRIIPLKVWMVLVKECIGDDNLKIIGYQW